MEQIVEVVIGKSTVQAVADRIEHQQAVLQIPTMSENKMKLHADQHHHERSFEESQIIWELEQIIKTRTKQLRNQDIIEYLIKWKNLPTANSTWGDDSFRKMHLQLPRRSG